MPPPKKPRTSSASTAIEEIEADRPVAAPANAATRTTPTTSSKLPSSQQASPYASAVAVQEIPANCPDSSRESLPGRVPELDGLRGLAILMVVIYHYVGGFAGPRGGVAYYLHGIFGAGWSGVDLFFVLSGFLIGGILLDARESSRYFSTFYLRRAHRILPVYYAWVACFVLASYMPSHWYPALLEASRAQLSAVPRYVLFVQNLFHQQGHFEWVWLAVTWSLAVEEQFYLLAPPLIRFLSLSRLTSLLIATVVLAPILRGLVFVRLGDAGGVFATMSMPCRADTLAMGILMAIAWRTPRMRLYLYEHTEVLYKTLGCLTVGVLTLMWWFLHPVSLLSVTVGLSVMGMFYACLMAVVLTDTRGVIAGLARSNFLQRLGCISYCVYVIHWGLNHVCHAVLLGAAPRISDWRSVCVTLLATALTWMIASASWRYFEKPLIRRGREYSY